MIRRAIRATLIRRVWATCRVPFALMPVTAATAVMMTARPSHPSQVIRTLHRLDLKVTSAPEQEQDHDDDQDKSDDPDATLRPPVVVGVVATASAEQQQDHDDQQYQVHDRVPPCSESRRSDPGLSRSSCLLYARTRGSRPGFSRGLSREPRATSSSSRSLTCSGVPWTPESSVPAGLR